MTNKSKRTHPLDRDGDGEPGGSLPGNQTAPMADPTSLEFALQPDADTKARILELREEASEAEDEGDLNAGAKLFDAADAMADRLGLDRDTLEPLQADRHDDLGADRPDTFDAEQVAAAAAAGEGAVMAEEGETVVDPAAVTAPVDLVAVDDGARQVAVRLRDLRILLSARRLYKSDQGFSASFGAPYIDQATVDALIVAGLAEAVPSAGNQGGVRATAKARQALADAQTPQVA